MNSGPTSERAYDVLKERILGGVFQPGQRLEPADLGQMLDMSITPVRDALHILVGEGLVEARTSNGFHLPLITEKALRDLYAWNAQVLLSAIARWPKTKDIDDARSDFAAPLAVSADPSALFARIAARSPNKEHLRMVRSNSDRLYAARAAEPAVLSGVDAELLSLTDAANSTNRGTLRRLLNAYHRRRLRQIAALVQAIIDRHAVAEKPL